MYGCGCHRSCIVSYSNVDRFTASELEILAVTNTRITSFRRQVAKFQHTTTRCICAQVNRDLVSVLGLTELS